MNKQFFITLLGLLICITPSILRAQNKAITWSTFSGGFNVSTSATKKVKSQAGTVVGTAEGSTTMLASGFFAGLLPVGLASVEDITGLPDAFVLKQNYPNPFNPITTIKYELPHQSDVKITIFDLVGRKVAILVSETQDAGYKSVTWEAMNISNGMYFYQIRTGEFTQVRKMVLLK